MRRCSKIRVSLARRKSIMGIDSEVFLYELAFTVIVVILRQPLMGLLVIPVHMFFRWVHKRDPLLPSAYFKYMKQPDLYDPWVQRSAMEVRPQGYGRGIHC